MTNPGKITSTAPVIGASLPIFGKLADLFSIGLYLADRREKPMVERLQKNIESLFQPEIQSALPPSMSAVLNQAVVNGVSMAFWIAFGAALLSLGLCFLLPGRNRV